MKKRIIALTVAIMMMLSSVALASDWVFWGHYRMANMPMDYDMYIDKDSAWSNNHEGGAFIKHVYPDNETHKMTMTYTCHFYYDEYKMTRENIKFYDDNGQFMDNGVDASIDASPGTGEYKTMMSFRYYVLKK